MKISTFISQPDAALVATANFAATTIAAAPGVYGLVTSNANAIASAATALSTRYDEYLTAKSAYESAVKAKAAARETFGTEFTKYMRQSYGTNTVTDAALAAIYLDPRPQPSPKPVQTPLQLFVDAFSNGYIKAKWKRNGNTSGTTYVLEAQPVGGDWEIVWSGTTSKIELSGYTPGTQMTFRVYATKGEDTSQPSNTFTIYEDGGDSAIRIAA